MAVAGCVIDRTPAVGACAWSAGTLVPDFISQQEPCCWPGVSDITGEPAPFTIMGQPAGHSLLLDLAGAQLATTANAVEDIATAAISIRAASWSRRDIDKFEGTATSKSVSVTVVTRRDDFGHVSRYTQLYALAHP